MVPALAPALVTALAPDSAHVCLSSLPPGGSATVVAIAGGRAMAQRMLMLGIRRGVQLRLLQGPGVRGAVVGIGGARIALGRSVTQHIRVQANPPAASTETNP